MMDCRHALEILDLADREVDRLTAEPDAAAEQAAAEAHLESCPACERKVRRRRELDRNIGRVMQAVPIPRGAQQRLLVRLAEVEAADSVAATGQTAADLELADAAASNGSQPPALIGFPAIRPAKGVSLPSRRRFLKRLVPLAACLAVAMAGFFGVVWLFMPRWSVDDISKALAEIDIDSMGTTLGDFGGSEAAERLPDEPGWERLRWKCGRQAKGLPLAPNMIAVYGFDVPETRRAGSVRGLIAVIPLSRFRNPPAAASLANAAPAGGYLSARIGESVCVAWQQGDFVYVCLIQGGGDSLGTLQGLLQQPAA
jgi:hypothetical protein